MAKWIRRIGAGLMLGIGALWLGNSSALLRGTEDHDTRLLSHRGVHQIYIGTDRSVMSCHAAPLAPVAHRFIENTVPSMQEAFRLGAAVVELDVHLTTDGKFAVFHDWTLDCRTDGTGVTRGHTLATLQQLDLGYRLDDGKQRFPLRGQGRGMMPSLEQVLATAMPGAMAKQSRFLINFKSNDPEEGRALASLLEDPVYRAQIWGVYGGENPVTTLRATWPEIRGFTKSSVRACLLRYLFVGWAGHVPSACRDTMVMVPQNYAPLLWGWPHRFTRRMDRAGSTVILVGPYDGSGFSSGIDTEEAMEKVPAHFDGFVWTDRIEVLGPVLSK